MTHLTTISHLQVLQYTIHFSSSPSPDFINSLKNISTLPIKFNTKTQFLNFQNTLDSYFPSFFSFLLDIAVLTWVTFLVTSFLNSSSQSSGSVRPYLVQLDPFFFFSSCKICSAFDKICPILLDS